MITRRGEAYSAEERSIVNNHATWRAAHRALLAAGFRRPAGGVRRTWTTLQGSQNPLGGANGDGPGVGVALGGAEGV